MSAIAGHLVSNALVLFNESFAATNEREGSEIVRQITRALVERGVRVFFVTHLYDFAHSWFRGKMGNTLFLHAERQADGTRTFRLVEGEPLETSYGEDLYEIVVGGRDHRDLATTQPLGASTLVEQSQDLFELAISHEPHN